MIGSRMPTAYGMPSTGFSISAETQHQQLTAALTNAPRVLVRFGYRNGEPPAGLPATLQNMVGRVVPGSFRHEDTTLMVDSIHAADDQESNPPAHEPVRACLLDLIVIEQAQAHLGPEFSYPHTSLGVLFARALRYRPIRFAFTGSPTSNAWSAWLNYQLSGTLPSLESMWSVRWNNEVIYSASDNTRYMLTGGLPGLLAPDIPVAWINTRDRVSIFDTVEPTTGVNLVSIYGDVRIALGVWPDDTNYGFIDTFTPEQLEFWQNVDIRLRATDATTESLMINTRMLDYRPPGAPAMELCCDACGRELAARRKCSACRLRRYCNVYCQRSDWAAGHKDDCKALVRRRQEEAAA